MTTGSAALKTNSVALLICLGAFLVRLLFNVLVIGFDTPGLDFFVDWKEYDAVGQSVANGSGFALHGQSYTTHPPGYGLFLGAIYAIYGHSYAAVKLLQSILGALTCWFIFLLGERLFSREVGLIAASIAAFYPFLVFYTGFLITETLFVFTCMLFLYLLVRVENSPTVLWAALAGLLLGLVNLIRPTLLLFPAFLFFWAWMSFRTLNRAAVITGIVVGVMVVTILPWTVRNYVVTGALVPIVTTHWVTLYGAHNEHILNDPEAIGGWVQPRPMDEAVYRSEYFSFLKHYLFQEPETLVMLGLHKLKRFWSIFPKTKTARRDGIISLCSYGLLLPFFLNGLYLSLKRSRPPWILFCWILYFCFLTLITHGTTRYRLPVEPAIILFASSTLERIRLRWSKTQSAVPPVEEKGKRGQAFG